MLESLELNGARSARDGVRRLLAGTLLAAGLLPGAASAASLCATALQQLQQSQQAELANIDSQLTDAQTDKNNAVVQCDTDLQNATAGGVTPDAAKKADDAHRQCVVAAQKDYNTTTGTIAKERNSIDGEFTKAQIQLTGTCAWTPQQINTLIASVGSAVSQIEQGTAALITASKGSSSSGTKPGSTTEPTKPATTTKPPTGAKPPATHNGSTAPGSGSSGDGSGSSDGSSGTSGSGLNTSP